MGRGIRRGLCCGGGIDGKLTLEFNLKIKMKFRSRQEGPTQYASSDTEKWQRTHRLLPSAQLSRDITIFRIVVAYRRSSCYTPKNMINPQDLIPYHFTSRQYSEVSYPMLRYELLVRHIAARGEPLVKKHFFDAFEAVEVPD